MDRHLKILGRGLIIIPTRYLFFIFIRHFINQLISHWSKSATGLLGPGTLTGLTRNWADLLVENAILHQQLIILDSQVNRPQLNNSERIRLVSLARFPNFWQSALHIAQPETLLRWQRELFRIYWRQKSKNTQH
jgi:hypothetical protein